MDQLLFGNVYTMDHLRPYAQAIGIQDGKIAFVGSRAEAKGLKAAEVSDFGDCAILPGFIDTHIHINMAGIYMEGVNAAKAKNFADVIALGKEGAARTEPGKWVFISAFQDKYISEKRFLRRADLDAISVDHPILLSHNDGHPIAINTAAIKLVGLDPLADGVECDESGVPTGFVTDPGCGHVRTYINGVLTDEDYLRSCHNVDDYAVKNGCTTVFNKNPYRILKLYHKHRDAFKFEMRTLQHDNLSLLDTLLADDELRGQTCFAFFADGAFDAVSGAVYEPYVGTDGNFGLLNYSDDEMYAFASKAHRNGLQLSCHAIGDRGIDQVLRVYERILKDYPREDHRHRIEHFEMPSKAAIKKAAELGIAMGMQPLLLEYCEGMDMEGYRCYIGDRVKRCSPYRSALDAGILISGGSDFPVTPMEPLHAIAIGMQHPIESERFSLIEGLEMYTVNAAKLGFLEDRKGRLAPGMDADIVVLDANPFRVDVQSLSQIGVIRTICRGRMVYSA